MNSTPRRAFGSTDQPRRSDVSLDLTTARKMLPLVRQIVSDILARLVPLPCFQKLEDDPIDHLLVGVELRIGTYEERFRIIRHDDSLLSVDGGRDHASECKCCSHEKVSQSILLDELSISS